jgi:hypothetical protein
MNEGWFGHGPLPTQRREGRGDGDRPESRRFGQVLGAGGHQIGHLVPHAGNAQLGQDRHRLTLEVVAAQPGLPSADRRQAERVPRIEAVAGVEVAGGVPHRAGQATQGGCPRRVAGTGTLGDAAVGGFQAEQPGEAGRDPDGTPAVAAGGDGQEAAGDGRGRAAGGPARCHGLVPRIARRPVKLGRGAVEPAELAGRRLHGQDRTGGAESGDRGGLIVGDPVLEDHGGVGEGPALDALEFLHPEGHPAEGQGDVGVPGCVAGPVEVGMAGHIERRALEGIDTRVERLERGEILGPKGLHQAAGVVHPRRAHGRRTYSAGPAPAQLLEPPGASGHPLDTIVEWTRRS